jgi:hypothetical protein
VVDSFTVRFRILPHAGFLDFWTWFVLLPARLLGDVPPAGLRNHPYGQRPLGNGPFRFARHVPEHDPVPAEKLSKPTPPLVHRKQARSSK